MRIAGVTAYRNARSKIGLVVDRVRVVALVERDGSVPRTAIDDERQLLALVGGGQEEVRTSSTSSRRPRGPPRTPPARRCRGREVGLALAVDVEVSPHALAVQERGPAAAPPARLPPRRPTACPRRVWKEPSARVVAVGPRAVKPDLGLEAGPAVPPAEREVRARGRERTRRRDAAPFSGPMLIRSVALSARRSRASSTESRSLDLHAAEQREVLVATGAGGEDPVEVDLGKRLALLLVVRGAEGDARPPLGRGRPRAQSVRRPATRRPCPTSTNFGVTSDESTRIGVTS